MNCGIRWRENDEAAVEATRQLLLPLPLSRDMPYIGLTFLRKGHGHFICIKSGKVVIKDINVSFR